MIVIGWVLMRARRGDFSSEYFGPVDYTALYWHLVDIIWIFLFGGGWAFMAFLGRRAQKRRKLQYLPPELAGGGKGVQAFNANCGSHRRNR